MEGFKKKLNIKTRAETETRWANSSLVRREREEEEEEDESIGFFNVQRVDRQSSRRAPGQEWQIDCLLSSRTACHWKQKMKGETIITKYQREITDQ